MRPRDAAKDALKGLEKLPDVVTMPFPSRPFDPLTSEPEAPPFAHRPLPAPDPAGAVARALSGGAVLSRRPSGLDADGLALAEGRAGEAARGRPKCIVARFAAHGGGLGGRQILQPSRRRLGCVARGDG